MEDQKKNQTESSGLKEDSSKPPRQGRGGFSLSKKDSHYMMFGLKIAGDFGATIAVPIIAFVLLGRWLDRIYDSNPWFTLLAFVLAALLSAVSIARKAKRYGREYENIDK